MAETIFWWVYALASAFGFILGYGIIEDLVRQSLKKGVEPQNSTGLFLKPRLPNALVSAENSHRKQLLH